MKLDIDLKSGSLKTDIKSLKKAARQAIAPELMRRVSKIIKEENLEIDSDQKIYCLKNPIATLIPGKIPLFFIDFVKSFSAFSSNLDLG